MSKVFFTLKINLKNSRASPCLSPTIPRSFNAYAGLTSLVEIFVNMPQYELIVKLSLKCVNKLS